LTNLLLFVYNILAMKLQQFDPKIVSITQLRRNIYALEGILAKEEEAFVMRNQDLMFIAVAPERYQELKEKQTTNTKVEVAIAAIDKLRKNVGQRSGSPTTDYLIEMRDRRKEKWITE